MATVPTSTRQRIDISNPIITRIQVEGNDVVSFLNGTNYIRGMSQILPQSPTYISYRYDSITISQVGGEAFTFTVYTITDVGGNTFTQLTFQDSSDVVQAKTIEIYRLLVTSVFKGCCECGNTEPECSIQYTARESGPENIGAFIDGGSAIRVNYFTANNQDFTGFWPIIQDGSWMFVFSKTDPTVYGVYQLSNYTDGGTYARFDVTLLTGPAGFPDGTTLCLDVTSVGGSLVQGWQDTLDIDSVLDKDNTVDGAGFNFVFDNNESFTINSGGGSVETDATGASLNAGDQQILVTSGYIDIVTPNYATATEGMVLALTAAGHVEYTLAGTGTISSIGLNMPSAFTVSTPNPLTENGDFTVEGAGDATQYINGLGELATLPVYTVENGLHAFGGVPGEAPPDPFLFHLGGRLREDTLIETTDGTTEFQLSVRGSVDQDTQFPFGVANLGSGGVATFQDYGSGARPNPSVEIVGDVDLLQPLLELNMEGELPTADDTLLRLRYSGDPSLAMMTIDYQFRNNNVVVASSNFIGSRLSTEVVSFVDGNEETRFEVQLVDNGTLSNKLELQGFGQLVLNEYATSAFSNGVSNIDNDLEYVLAVDSSGNVYKKISEGGGTVTEVDATGLLTTSPDPITTTGTVTSIMDSGFLVGRYSSGTGVFEQITIGDGLTLSPTGELTAEGGEGTYDGDQGVYKDTTLTNDTFMLGAPLGTGSTIPFQEAREVDVAENYLYIKGTNTSRLTNQEVLFVEHLAEGIGVYGQSLGESGTGIGIKGYSDFGSGVVGETDQGFGVYAYAQGTGGLGYAFFGQSLGGYGMYLGSALENKFIINVPLGPTNSVFTNLNLSRRDTPAGGVNVGYGVSLDLELLESGTYPITSRIASVWANQPSPFDPNNAHLEFSTYGNSTLEVVGRFKGATAGNGQLQLTKYTTATSFAAASGASVGVLNVDDQGNVFVGEGGEGQTYTVNNGLEPQTLPTPDPNNFQLGGPLVRDTVITSSGETLSIDYSALPTSGFNINGNAPSSASGQTLMTISNSGTTVGDSFETISLAVNNNHESDFGTNYGIVVDVSGSPDGDYGIKSTASTNGGMFYGGQYGVFGSSTSSTGIAGYFEAKNGSTAVYAIITSATAQQALYANAPGLVNYFVMNSDDVLDSVKEHTVFERQNKSVTVPSNGFGERIQFKLAYESTGGGVNTNSITSRWLNADYAPGNGLTEFSFSGVSGFTDNTILSLIGTGQIQLNQYTTSTAFADGLTSIGVLNVDNTGKVFVGEGGEGQTYTVNNGLEPQTTPAPDANNFQLGGPLVRNTTVTGSLNAYDLTFDEMSDFTVNSKAKITLFAEDPSDPSVTSTVYSAFGSAYIEHVDSSGTGQVISQTGEVIMSYSDGVDLNVSASVTGLSASMNYSDASVSFPGHQLIVDATGIKAVTPNVKDSSATVGQVLTLQNATTGEVEFQDAGGGGGGGVGRSYYLNGSVVQGDFAGITDMRQMSPVPVIGTGTDFTINTDGFIKSFITDAGDPNKAVIPAGNWNFELWFSVNNPGGSPNFYVELSKYDGAAFTPIATGVASPTNITTTAITLYITALSVPQTTLALTDRLAVRVWVNHGGGGKVVTLHTQGPHLSQIITDFPSGIVSLNGLTAFAQTFATPGTTGTAPAWSSSTSIHTLNIPLASASGVTAGLLSNTDWTRFDSFKTQTIGVTVDGSGGVITAGIKGYVRVPYACTITSWSIITNVTGGTLSFDIWRANNAIPTVGTPLVGGGTKPNISGQITSSAPVNWTATTLAANDVLAFNVEAGATVYSWAILQLTVTRT